MLYHSYAAAEIEKFPLIIQSQNTITAVEELLVEFNGVVDTYSNAYTELDHRPLSIVKCARVVDDAEDLMVFADVYFLCSIQTSRQICQTIRQLRPTYINLLESNESSEAQKTVAMIAMIDEASNAIDW